MFENSRHFCTKITLRCNIGSAMWGPEEYYSHCTDLDSLNMYLGAASRKNQGIFSDQATEAVNYEDNLSAFLDDDVIADTQARTGYLLLSLSGPSNVSVPQAYSPHGCLLCFGMQDSRNLQHLHHNQKQVFEHQVCFGSQGWLVSALRCPCGAMCCMNCLSSRGQIQCCHHKS